MPSQYRLIAFDMDGTLVKGKSSWLKIHKHFHTVSLAKHSLQLYLKGRISYEEFMKKDIEVWPKPIHISQIIKILSTYRIRSGAKYVVEEVHRRGLSTAVISGGIKQLAEKVAVELGIPYVVANELCLDEHGFLTGSGVMKVDPLHKELALKKLAEQLNLNLDQCIAVGDSPFDFSFLKSAGFGLYLGDESEAKKIGVMTINSLREILQYI